MAHDVFISHSRHDKAVADAIVATLEREGISCWIAPRNVVPGADWGHSLIQGIRASRALVLVLSSAANSSRHILREVERAVHMGVPIVPLRIEDVLPEGALEFHLSTVHWLDAFTPPVETHLQQLVRTLLAILQRDPQASVASTSGAPSRTSEKVPQPAQAPAKSPDFRSSSETQPKREGRKDVPPKQASPSAQKKPSYLIFGAIAILIISGLVYWATRHSDPFAQLRKVDWSTVQVDDPHFADCQAYAPCDERKSRSQLLKNTDWNKELYNSPLFKDCMGYPACTLRRELAAKLVAIKDWSKIAPDNALLKDCMGYVACIQAEKSLHKPPPLVAQQPKSQSACSLEALPSCCNDAASPDACRKCKDSLHILYQDCRSTH